MGITTSFSYPFYTGTAQATSGIVPWELEIALGGHAYKINVAEYQRSTLPMLRQPQDNGEEPGEQSLATEGWWRRTVTDWSYGAGQEYGDDLVMKGNRAQFHHSFGVDPWVRGELRLMDDVYQVASFEVRQILRCGNYVYVHDYTNNQIKWATVAALEAVANHTGWPTAPTAVTWTSADIYAGSAVTSTNHIQRMAALGDTVYVALGTDGIHKTTAGASTSTAVSLGGSHTVELLEYANGFLFFAEGTDLHTVSATGTVGNVTTSIVDPSFRWKSIVATPSGVYAAGDSGWQGSEIYFIGLDDTTGGLKAAVSAGTMPAGEQVRTMKYYQGIMLLGTSRGLRIGTITNNGLAYGPYFGTGNDNNNGYGVTNVQDFAAIGERVYFTWANYTPAVAGFASASGLGHINLARFSEPLIPSYASDLMHAGDSASYAVYAWGAADNAYPDIYRVFGTNTGLYINTRKKPVAAGYLVSSKYRFGTAEKKLIASLDLRHDLLATGDSVAAALIVSDDNNVSGTTTDIGASSQLATSSPATPFAAHSLPAETVQVLLTLTRPAVGTACRNDSRGFVFRWTLRAALTPYRQDEILVPLILFDAVDTNDEYGQDTYYDTLAEFQFLKSLESDRQVVAYQEGAATYQVVVDRVIVKPYSWNNGKTFFNGTVYVRLLTVEV